MDVIESMDREIIIERAEAVRFWLLGLKLSSRASGAIQRELGAIIADDPGRYIDGQRPLAGLTIAAFIAELHRPNGGVVGRVKSVGDVVLNELRAVIPADTGASRQSAAPAPKAVAPDAPAPTADVEAVAAVETMVDATPVRRRGRPKGSTKAPKRIVVPLEAFMANNSGSTASIAETAQKVAPMPAETQVMPAVCESDDSMLSQIVRLWPSLHPHARRAVVMYASALWIEAEHKG